MVTIFTGSKVADCKMESNKSVDTLTLQLIRSEYVSSLQVHGSVQGWVSSIRGLDCEPISKTKAHYVYAIGIGR